MLSAIKDISIIFAKLKANYDKVISFLRAFIKNIERAIISQSESEHKRVMDAIYECETLNIDESDDLIQYTYGGYNYFATLDKLIPPLLALFRNKQYIEYRNSFISFNSIQLEEVQRTNTVDLYRAAKRSCLGYDKQIFDYFKIGTSIDEGTITLFITKNREINRFTIFLLGRAINTKSRANKILLTNLIEADKDKILRTTKKVNNGIINILLSRYNLIPATYFNAIEEPLNEAAFNKIIKGIIESKQVNLIAITKSANHALEYNLEGILNEKYIVDNNIKTFDNEGLNERFITRMNTIQSISAHSKSVKNKNNESWTIDLYNIEAARWLVMEIMCGKYRFMTQFNINGTTSTKHHIFDYAIPADQIRGLIDGISARPSAYNIECTVDNNADSIDYIDSTAKHIVDDYTKREEIIYSTEPIKKALYERIIKYLPARIASIKQFRQIELEPVTITNLFYMAMPFKQRVGGPTSGSLQKEVYLLYYARLYNITNEFMKLFQKELYLAPIMDDLKAFTEVATQEYFMRALQGVVNKTLDQLDSVKMFSNFAVSLKEIFIEREWNSR